MLFRAGQGFFPTVRAPGKRKIRKPVDNALCLPFPCLPSFPDSCLFRVIHAFWPGKSRCGFHGREQSAPRSRRCLFRGVLSAQPSRKIPGSGGSGSRLNGALPEAEPDDGGFPPVSRAFRRSGRVRRRYISAWYARRRGSLRRSSGRKRAPARPRAQGACR